MTLYNSWSSWILKILNSLTPQVCFLLKCILAYAFIQVNLCQKLFFFAERGENKLCAKIVLNVRSNFCTQHVRPRFELGIFMYWTCNSMNNLLSYCELVDAKIRASDKDLPVLLVSSWLRSMAKARSRSLRPSS